MFMLPMVEKMQLFIGANKIKSKVWLYLCLEEMMRMNYEKIQWAY